MEKLSMIIQLVILFQLISIISNQDLNIIKNGRANFANVNFFKGEQLVLMGTSGLPYSNKKILYEIGNNFAYYNNGSHFIDLPQNSTNYSISTNHTYRNLSEQSLYYDAMWITLSGNNYLELYDIEYEEYYSITLEDFFGFSDYIELGNIVEFYTERKKFLVLLYYSCYC